MAINLTPPEGKFTRNGVIVFLIGKINNPTPKQLYYFIFLFFLDRLLIGSFFVLGYLKSIPGILISVGLGVASYTIVIWLIMKENKNTPDTPNNPGDDNFKKILIDNPVDVPPTERRKRIRKVKIKNYTSLINDKLNNESEYMVDYNGKLNRRRRIVKINELTENEKKEDLLNHIIMNSQSKVRKDKSKIALIVGINNYCDESVRNSNTSDDSSLINHFLITELFYTGRVLEIECILCFSGHDDSNSCNFLIIEDFDGHRLTDMVSQATQLRQLRKCINDIINEFKVILGSNNNRQAHDLLKLANNDLSTLQFSNMLGIMLSEHNKQPFCSGANLPIIIDFHDEKDDRYPLWVSIEQMCTFNSEKRSCIAVAEMLLKLKNPSLKGFEKNHESNLVIRINIHPVKEKLAIKRKNKGEMIFGFDRRESLTNYIFCNIFPGENKINDMENSKRVIFESIEKNNESLWVFREEIGECYASVCWCNFCYSKSSFLEFSNSTMNDLQGAVLTEECVNQEVRRNKVGQETEKCCFALLDDFPIYLN